MLGFLFLLGTSCFRRLVLGLLFLLGILGLLFASESGCFGIGYAGLFLTACGIRACCQFHQVCDGLFTEKTPCQGPNLLFCSWEILAHLSISAEESLYLFGHNTDLFLLYHFIKHKLTFHALFGIRFEFF